jgi:hypothetical protein
MSAVVIIKCNGCDNVVQMPRADVEAADALNCSCGSTDLEIRDPSGNLLVHKSQAPQAGPPQVGAPQAPQMMMPEGLVYQITCQGCGNQVDMDGAQYEAAEQAGQTIKCNCGSTDLKVERPPPTTAEMMMAVRQMTSGCPLCGNTGWVEVEGGRMFPCKACQGV